MSLPRALVLIAVLSLVAAPSAAARLPVGEADGVRIFRVKGALVVKFTPRAEKLRRRVAGRLVSVICTNFPPDMQSFGPFVISSGGGTYRMPKRGRTLRTGDFTRRLDYCRVALVRGRPRSTQPIVAVPLTQFGAVYLDEEEKAMELLRLLSLAGFAAERLELEVLPTYARLVDFLRARPNGPSPDEISGGLVGLASLSDTPPVGKLGYYSDGAGRTVVAVVSRSGRRLFIEGEPDDVLRTNVQGFIYGDRDS
jgi:hypothetical protein